MRSDDELERELEAHFEANARPLPEHVSIAVLEHVPRERQSTGLWAWYERARPVAAVVAVAAVIVLAVAFGPVLLERLGTGPGASREPPSPTPTYEWDAVLNFRGFPNQTNPSMDAYGHSAVWSYLRSDGPVHVPEGYVRLSVFDEVSNGWYDGAPDHRFVGSTPGANGLTLRPSAPTPADPGAVIVAWRAPIDVSIDLTGRVEVDATCGDGITFWLDRGEETVETYPLAGGMRDIATRLEVRQGETLYFGVEAGPAGDADCDTTWLQLTIRG